MHILKGYYKFSSLIHLNNYFTTGTISSFSISPHSAPFTCASVPKALASGVSSLFTSAQEETEIADGIVVPEAPEVPIMDFDFPTPPDVPNMPDVPEIPENMDDKKAWKKYEDEIKVYEKKIKDLEPEWKNYEKEMKVFELKMKQIEPELKKYEKKMKEIEPELKKYDKKMEEFERKIKIQEQRIRNKSKENNKA
jgi:hypothetical protein